MITCLAAHIRPPDEADHWLELIGDDRAGGGDRLAKINLHSARFCADVHQLFENPVKDEVWVIQMLQRVKQALLIDKEYVSWNEKETVGIWTKRQAKSANIKPGNLPTYVYRHLVMGFTWSYYRAARIHVNEMLRRCIQFIKLSPIAQNLDLDLETIYDESTKTVPEMVLGIQAGSAFCLGDINSNGAEGGYRMPLAGRAMIWPIYRAVRSCDEGSNIQIYLIGKLE